MNNPVCYPRPVRTNTMSRPGIKNEPANSSSNINIDQISAAEMEKDFINKKNENDGCNASKEIMNILYSPQCYDNETNINHNERQMIRKENNSKKNYNYYCYDDVKK